VGKRTSRFCKSYDLATDSDQSAGPRPVINIDVTGLKDTTYVVTSIPTTTWLSFGRKVRIVANGVAGDWSSSTFFWLSPAASTGAPSVEIPAEFVLMQNCPTPFNPGTTIRFGLPHRSHVSVTVINTLGQIVKELVNGEIGAGYHSVGFDAPGLPSGMYLDRLHAPAPHQHTQAHGLAPTMRPRTEV